MICDGDFPGSHKKDTFGPFLSVHGTEIATLIILLIWKVLPDLIFPSIVTSDQTVCLIARNLIRINFKEMCLNHDTRFKRGLQQS